MRPLCWTWRDGVRSNGYYLMAATSPLELSGRMKENVSGGLSFVILICTPSPMDKTDKFCGHAWTRDRHAWPGVWVVSMDTGLLPLSGVGFRMVICLMCSHRPPELLKKQKKRSHRDLAKPYLQVVHSRVLASSNPPVSPRPIEGHTCP